MKNEWIPLYEMVTFEDIRYSEALKKGDQQRAIMDQVLQIEDIEKWYNTNSVRLLKEVKQLIDE